MNKVRITREELERRLALLRAKMQEEKLDAVFVYGDEYRKESLRYVSNYWPIFDRGALLAGATGEPSVCPPPAS